MGCQELGGVTHPLGQPQELFPQLVRRLEYPPHQIKPPEPEQHGEELWGLAELLAEFPCPGVGVFHFWSGLALDGHQGGPQGGLHQQLVLGTLRRLWQGLEQLDPSGAVADGFQIGRAFTGLLTCPLPVANGLLCEPSLSIVMGQQLGLRLAALGKARLQHLGNALMVLLAGATQQRLIGHVLDECMLERVGGLRR